MSPEFQNDLPSPKGNLSVPLLDPISIAKMLGNSDDIVVILDKEQRLWSHDQSRWVPFDAGSVKRAS